ncbi:esterase/lipase family protein [Acinetobacter guillouiae]|uniref:esterase/lipase family protein n=1 Tax=Acinetobacter guillouiae TaxID=106649 RepID=UPI003AF8C5C9
MKIIMVHGINQADKDPDTLKHIWVTAFLDGVFQAGLTKIPETTKIEFVYYGDKVKLYLDNDKSDNGLFDLRTRGLHAFTLNIEGLNTDEKAILESIANNLDDEETLPEDVIPKNILVPSSFKDKVAKAIIKITSHYGKIHTWGLKNFAREASLYLNNVKYRNEVKAKLLEKIEENQDEDVVLIGHSLGSVVCFDVMQNLDPKYKISRFITLGSPLGIPVFYNFFNNRNKPLSLKGEWINFYDTDDFVAAYLLKNPPYTVQPEIQNIRAKTQYFQPHFIVGYLDDALVAQKILGL